MNARIERVMSQYNCDADDAQRFIDLRDDGHGVYAAALMAGLADPPDPDETIEVYKDFVVTSPGGLGDA
jgi:hypothetical protein